MLQHVEPVTLRLDQIRVRMRARPRFSAKAPGCEHEITEIAALDCFSCTSYRLGIAVVEVDREEQIALRRRVEQNPGFVELEDQRLLGEQRDAGLDDLESRIEVTLVVQRETDEIRLLRIEHA